LRPADSPLFDNGQAQWWKFLVLDEAHQYRGSHGIEMAMLLRRLKQRCILSSQNPQKNRVNFPTRPWVILSGPFGA